MEDFEVGQYVKLAPGAFKHLPNWISYHSGRSASNEDLHKCKTAIFKIIALDANTATLNVGDLPIDCRFSFYWLASVSPLEVIARKID